MLAKLPPSPIMPNPALEAMLPTLCSRLMDRFCSPVMCLCCSSKVSVASVKILMRHIVM